jgi:ACS family tartrate transporter-like MFS transporter
MDAVVEQKLMRKLNVRLIPFLIFLYVISYLDRVNVSFAALTMNKDIGLNAYTYGWGAGIFFIGYCAFEVPANVALVRFGARRWIARILFSWGIAATLMAWITGPGSFLTMRFILGAAEAGYFPGVILFLTYWFPARYRARIISRFMLAIPISLAVGAPVSTWVLQHFNGLMGLRGWQWLYLTEGLPAVLGAVAVLMFLPDSPAKAGWLSAEEKAWIARELVLDAEKIDSVARPGIWQAFSNPVIWLFGFVYFADTGANLGLSMFLPQMIKAQGFSTIQTGFMSSVPYIFGIIGMLAIGHSSDHFKERKWHVIFCLMLIGVGLGMAGYLGNGMAALMLICVASVGIMGCKGPFWPLPSAYLTGAGAAAGIALINSLGNLGGFTGPYIIGWAKHATNSYSGGLYSLAALAFLAVFVTFFSVKVKKAGAAVPAGGLAADK